MDVDAIRVRADDAEDLAAARESARQASVQVTEVERPPPGTGFEPRVEPVSAILIGGAVIALGKFVVDWWERRRGGLVIDLRPDREDDLYRDRDVPYGFIVTFTADGKVTVETKDIPKDAMERLLGEIISGAYGTVEAVADAASEVAGKGKVKAEPAAS